MDTSAVYSENNKIIVKLKHDDLAYCDQLSIIKDKHKEWGKHKNGKANSYGGGAGNKNKEGDKRKVERMGAIGEVAFSIMTGLKVNEEYLANGDDGWDFVYNNQKIDIKGHFRYIDNYNYLGLHSPFYVKATQNRQFSSQEFVLSELKSNFYFHCCVDWKNHTYLNSCTEANVKFYGAMLRDDILKFGKLDRPATRGQDHYFGDNVYNAKTAKWLNYYYEEKYMIPATEFMYKFFGTKVEPLKEEMEIF